MHQHVALLLVVLLVALSSILVAGQKAYVPPIHHGWYYGDDYDHKTICKFLLNIYWHIFFLLPSTASTYENIVLDAAETLRNWDFAREENVWERSGLLEGDIMVLPKRNELRNVVLSDYYNWPNATIPYVLQEGMSKLSAKLFDFKLC